MWNGTDTPLAIFFTFRCYGTWLHGDERGKGSKRRLWNEKSIWEACNYVNNEQGDKLPDFDWW